MVFEKIWLWYRNMMKTVEELIEYYGLKYPSYPSETIVHLAEAYIDGRLQATQDLKEDAKKIVKQTYSFSDDNSPIGSNPYME